MDELKAPRPLAVVTGASSGIGFHLALCAADHGFDLVLAADTPLDQVTQECRAAGATVQPVECDLASNAGVRELVQAIGARQVDSLMANAGHGLGGGFLEQHWDAILHVINTNITGTLYLIRLLGARMRAQGTGRILVTGSVAGFQPGSFHAVYNASKAFVDSFAMALRNELKDTGVSVTCLIPGPTDTEFFERADLLNTHMVDLPKMDPAKVARAGFDAMLRGEGDAVPGLTNKAQVAISKLLTSEAVAEFHRKVAEPIAPKE